ncbi:MAG TPA: lysozyme inhibitor LprI family protein [Xanthobacteraceae bacterium]
MALPIMLMLDAGGAVAADAIPYPVRDCGQLTVQMEINACAGANLQAADAALNKVYRQVMVQQSDTASKDQLKEVERAWIAYRDRECALEVGPQEDGGSIWPMEMSNCLEKKTATRIRELTRLPGCIAGVSVCNSH